MFTSSWLWEQSSLENQSRGCAKTPILTVHNSLRGRGFPTSSSFSRVAFAKLGDNFSSRWTDPTQLLPSWRFLTKRYNIHRAVRLGGLRSREAEGTPVFCCCLNRLRPSGSISSGKVSSHAPPGAEVVSSILPIRRLFFHSNAYSGKRENAG